MRVLLNCDVTPSCTHHCLPPAPPLAVRTSLRDLLPAVVPVLLGDGQPGGSQPFLRGELPHVPQLDGLVFRVADEVTGISLVGIRDVFSSFPKDPCTRACNIKVTPEEVCQ